MAYPNDTGASYNTKVNNVTTVDASDVNTIQTEVSAIKTLLGIIGSAVSGTFYYVTSEITGSDIAVGKTATQTLSNKTFVAPVLGAATATSINKMAITPPATSSTLAVANGKTFTASNTLTLVGTDGTTITFQGTDTYIGRTTTDTMTNKRITKRVLALSAGSATPAINTDLYDVVNITAQSAAITSFTSSLTGTPVDGDTLRISITDNGTASAITWGASFENSGNVTLPTTTVISTRLDVGFFWNSATNKFRCVAVA